MSLKKVAFKRCKAVRQQYSSRHIMTSYNQFDDRLSQRDNHFSSYKNNAIALDIEVIRKCEDLRNDSE